MSTRWWPCCSGRNGEVQFVVVAVVVVVVVLGFNSMELKKLKMRCLNTEESILDFGLTGAIFQ